MANGSDDQLHGCIEMVSLNKRSLKSLLCTQWRGTSEECLIQSIEALPRGGSGFARLI